jgi:hypothetical protein
VGVDERIDDLLQIAFLNGVDTGDGGITAADLAVRIWLKAPKALEKLVRDELFEKKRKFEHFPAREAGPGMSPEDLPQDLDALEGSLDQWFVAKKRGAGCVIDRAVAGSEARFLVAHGMPCKRERNRKGRESSPLYFRPEKTDLVIYDAATNELRAHAGTLGELRLYVSTFGHHLFGDPEQFVYTAKYTLEPLKDLGRDALRCRDIDGIESIRLREIRYLWPGAFEHVEIHRAFDLFLAFAMRRMAIHREPKITKAVFEVKLQGVEKTRKVSICPPNVAEYGHGDEAALIEEWLRRRGFILVGAAAGDEEADAVLAGA